MFETKVVNLIEICTFYRLTSNVFYPASPLWVLESRRGLGVSIFRRALGTTQPPIQWVPGALSLGVKRPGRGGDHSHPSSAEVKNTWSYTSPPPIRIHGTVLT
jgi:hypothetical protein